MSDGRGRGTQRRRDTLRDVAVNLQWTATDNLGVTCVDLLLSRAGVGGPYETIATCIPNTGSYSWVVTLPTTTTAIFKVVAYDAAGNACEDVSDGVFTIEEAVSVLLSQFEANPAEVGVELRWALSDATVFEQTAIERSEAIGDPWTVVDAPSRYEGGEFVLLDQTAATGRTYWYRLTGTTPGGQEFAFEPVSATAGLPILEYSLPNVAPNPLRWPALVSFAVPRPTHVRVTVYDVKGRLVATLADRNYETGRYQVTWDGEGQGTRLVSGVYFVRLETPEKVLTRRVVNLH